MLYSFSITEIINYHEQCFKRNTNPWSCSSVGRQPQWASLGWDQGEGRMVSARGGSVPSSWAASPGLLPSWGPGPSPSSEPAVSALPLPMLPSPYSSHFPTSSTSKDSSDYTGPSRIIQADISGAHLVGARVPTQDCVCWSGGVIIWNHRKGQEVSDWQNPPQNPRLKNNAIIFAVWKLFSRSLNIKVKNILTKLFWFYFTIIQGGTKLNNGRWRFRETRLRAVLAQKPAHLTYTTPLPRGRREVAGAMG